MDTETFKQKGELLEAFFNNFYNDVVIIFTDENYKQLSEQERIDLSELFKGNICAMYKGLYGDDRLKALFETLSKEIY